MAEKKVTNVKVIVAEMLKGGQTVDEIANKVIEQKPGTKVSAVKSQIKGIIRLVKEAKKAKWLKYKLAEDGVSLQEVA